MFRMKKQEYKEQERHYYFFDYLFWLGEITWEHYHKVSFKQPRGSDMLWACITFFIFMPVLTIGWKSHATLTLLATQDLPTFGYNMIDPLKSWCWGSILFYPFKISRFS